MDLKTKILLIPLLLSSIAFGQVQGYEYESIEADSTFQPYINFDSQTGNYIIGYLKSVETGKVYETLYVPPTKVNPIFTVHLEKNADIYAYSYELENGTASAQDISSLELEIKDQFESIEISDPWYFRMNRVLPFIRITHKVYDVPEYEEGKPIRFESDLQIGETLEFIVNSSNPPSIVTSFISGQPKQISLSFVIPPSFEVRKMVDSLRANVVSKRGFELKTVGPQSIPDDIDNSALRDTLQSYLTFSCDTTWIENKGICRSLEAKLQNVEKELQRGNAQAALGPLRAFLNEVEAQNGKKISSEVYALLFFNGQFLLERL